MNPLPPVSEPPNPDYYPTVPNKHVIEQTGVHNGRPILKGCLLDLPVAERQQYMWMVPQALQSHPMYQQEPDTFKCTCAEREQTKADDAKKKEADLQATIQTLTDHLAQLTNQVNSLTQQNLACK